MDNYILKIKKQAKDLYNEKKIVTSFKKDICFFKGAGDLVPDKDLAKHR